MNTVAELFPLIKGQAGSAGVCSTVELMEKINVIGPELLDRIEAKGTVSTWCLPVCDNCLVLPSDLDTPLQAWLCGEPLGFRSEFWLGRLGGDIGYDMSQEFPWREIVNDGRYVHTQIYPVPACQNDAYELVARSPKDDGKEMMIKYRSSMGREITHQVKLQAGRASASSDTGIGEVIYVSKPRTVGAVELWMRNLSNHRKLLLAVYDGHDEQPQYRLMHLTGCANGSLVIKGRKKWMPLRADSDLVPFGRVAVWRVALMAEAALANRNIEEFAQLIAQAIGLLDGELTGLRPKGAAEIVDFVTPFTTRNRSPIRRKFS